MQTALPLRFDCTLCHLLLTLMPASQVYANVQSPSQVLLAVRAKVEASVSPFSSRFGLKNRPSHGGNYAQQQPVHMA